MLYITEAAALKLANVADMSEFEQLFSENRLRFPFLASVKVWRRPSKLSAVQSDSTQTQQDKDDFDCFSMGPVVPVGRVLHITAGVTNTCADDPRQIPDQLLHAPEAPTGKHCHLSCRYICIHFFISLRGAF